MRTAGLGFPVVAKPDLGWCGFGVRRLDDVAALAEYLGAFPAGETLMLQHYLDEPGEAGIFYLRHPDESRGRLLGILLRHYPQVVGDGSSTLGELVAEDARLRRAMERPQEHQCDFDPQRVPAHGEIVRLSLIGSTRVGGRYEDGSALATETLLDTIEAIARDMPQFHVGRFDVRYATLADLREGRFTIMEVNGAGSEAVHAWDPKYSVRQVYAMVFAKQRALFMLGAANRRPRPSADQRARTAAPSPAPATTDPALPTVELTQADEGRRRCRRSSSEASATQPSRKGSRL